MNKKIAVVLTVFIGFAGWMLGGVWLSAQASEIASFGAFIWWAFGWAIPLTAGLYMAGALDD